MRLPGFTPFPQNGWPLLGLATALLLTAALALLLAAAVYAQADETPPAVEKATVDGAVLTVTFSEDLKRTDTSGLKWALWVDGIAEGVPVSPASVSISGKDVTLVLGTAASSGQTVTVNYDADSAGEKLQDAAGNQVASFTGQEVKHASKATATPAPTPTATPTQEPTATPTPTPTPQPQETVPAKPTGLVVTTEQGSLDVEVDWDDVEGAGRYLVRWRSVDKGEKLNEGVEVPSSEADITLDAYGKWVVRVQACNGAGCGKPVNREFRVEAPNRAPVVDEQAGNYAEFVKSLNAPRGATVHKSFDGIFSDPDGDDLTYSVSVPDDRTDLVESVGIHESKPQLDFQYDADDDWGAVTPALPDPLTTQVTLTATDPDGLSASLTGDFQSDWESQPVVEAAEVREDAQEGDDEEGGGAQGDAQVGRARVGACESAGAVEVTFDQDLQTVPAPTPRQFTVNFVDADGSTGTIAVCSVSVSGRVVTLELDSSVQAGQTLTLDYAHRDATPLKRAAAGGDSVPGFTGRSVSPPTARQVRADATPVTLVSNLGQATGSTGNFGFDHAQGFNTGSHSLGYRLTGVGLQLRVVAPNYDPGVSLEIWSSDSSGRPLSKLGKLTNPASLISGVNRFTTSGIDLAANTTYLVVLDVTDHRGNQNGAFVQNTASNAEDSGAATGWSIADTSWYSGWTSFGESRMIAIYGYPITIDYDRDDDGLIEITNAAQLDAIRYDADGDGTPITAFQATYDAAFPVPAPGMGCPDSDSDGNPGPCAGYELARDIDLAGVTWDPIAAVWATTLDGNGRTISNLSVSESSASNPAALFEDIGTSGVVRNLGLTDVDVRGLRQVGPLAGNNRGLIVNTYATGRVTALNTDGTGSVQSIGGLVGKNGSGGKIYASFSFVSVSASAGGFMEDIGGLAGENNGGEIKASFAAGNVTVTALDDFFTQRRIAGLVGLNSAPSGQRAEIVASYSVGAVKASTAATQVGGLVGANTKTVTDSYWDMEASGWGASSGGVGKTTAELAAPTDYTGIYAGWNLDLDGDGTADDPWRFGGTRDYPGLTHGWRLSKVSRPTAFFPCTEEIELRPWNEVYVDRYKYSVFTAFLLAEGCYSRESPDRHAEYFTFTLTESTRVRLQAEGTSAVGAQIMLRKGVSRDTLHAGTWHGHPVRQRIDETLSPGDYTLEVTTDKPGGTGLKFWVWTGIAPTLSTQSTQPAPFWNANLAVKTVTPVGPQPEGCDDRYTGFECSTALTPNSFTHEGTTYQFTFILDEPPNLFVGFNTALPTSATDLTLRIAGRSFRLSDATISTNLLRATWSTANLNLTPGSTASVAMLQPFSCTTDVVQGGTYTGTYTDRWNAVCASTENPDSYARYYTYTPTADGKIRVFLTSPDVEEKLFLWEGAKNIAEHSSNMGGLCLGRCALISRPVKMGTTYTIEVTTDAPGQTGGYHLVVEREGSPPPAPAAPPADCRVTVPVEGGPPGSRPNGLTFGNTMGGKWGWPCYSVVQLGRYAQFYTFTLSASKDVLVELHSSAVASTHMYLRSGTNGSGAHVAESQHAPGLARTRMLVSLSAGTYTLEVVSTQIAQSGDISLVIKEPPSGYQPPAACVTTITIDGRSETTGEWDTDPWCPSRSEKKSYSRYYKFTLTESKQVTLSANSEDAEPVLNLYAGAAFSNPALATGQPWGGNKKGIRVTLGPGTYTVEVTTNGNAGEWQKGEFEFHYS